jgi:hypothetical protein
MARNCRPISARAERRAGELFESCAQRATLAKHFQWKHGISLDASVLSLGRVPRQIGGSDERDLSRQPIGCHGNLHTAGNASSPLYCRAGHSCRALLCVGTRGTSSSSAPVRSRSGTRTTRRLSGFATACYLSGCSSTSTALISSITSLCSGDCMSVDGSG